MFSGRIPGSSANQHTQRGRDDITTNSARRAQSSSPNRKNAEQLELAEQLDAFTNNFEKMHTATVAPIKMELLEFQSQLSEMKTNLASSQKKSDMLQGTLEKRRQGAKERAMSREDKIKGLEQENKELHEVMLNSNHYTGVMNQTIDSLSERLGHVNKELDSKSQTVSKQAKIISDIKKEISELQRSAQYTVQDKDSQIAKAEQENGELKVTQALRKINENYHTALNSYQENTLPEKTRLLTLTSEKIANEAEVLKKLNHELIKKNKELNQQVATINNERKVEVGALRANIDKLVELTGIEL